MFWEALCIAEESPPVSTILVEDEGRVEERHGHEPERPRDGDGLVVHRHTPDSRHTHCTIQHQEQDPHIESREKHAETTTMSHC